MTQATHLFDYLCIFCLVSLTPNPHAKFEVCTYLLYGYTFFIYRTTYKR